MHPSLRTIGLGGNSIDSIRSLLDALKTKEAIHASKLLAAGGGSVRGIRTLCVRACVLACLRACVLACLPYCVLAGVSAFRACPPAGAAGACCIHWVRTKRFTVFDNYSWMMVVCVCARVVVVVVVVVAGTCLATPSQKSPSCAN